MGWKSKRPKIKLGKGVYLNLNKNGASISARSKYGSRTTNLKTGKTKTTIRTPIPGLSYTTTSGESNKKATSKQAPSPALYKFSGWLSLIVGILATLIGLLTFAIGGVFLLIIGIVLIVVGVSFVKQSKSFLGKNIDLLDWQKTILPDSPDKLIMSQEQLQNESERQANEDLRIIQDCAKLISETLIPETFFSRLDLLKEKAKHLKLLEPYIEFEGTSPTAAFNEVLEHEQDAIHLFLERYYSAILTKAESMKTERGRANQYQKFCDSLYPYTDKMNEQNLDYIKHKRGEFLPQ